MEIVINVDVLSQHNLSLSEYVYLKALYEERSKEEMLQIISCIDRIEEDSLQDRGFIKILPDNEIILRDKSTKLFESGSLFLRYLTTFPVKTPSGRPLSPVGADTVKGKKMEAKWNKLFKNKPHKEKRALEVLEAELEWRKANNKMEFMHNAEAWLNQGDYENFEYLLEEFKQKQESYTDFM